jgi:hypothetical protein
MMDKRDRLLVSLVLAYGNSATNMKICFAAEDYQT